MSLYDIKLTTIDGRTMTMNEYRDQVILIVNVASQCGFTPQYIQLQSLYIDYHHRGLSILGFPCNQFFSQEKGSDQEIKQFCSTQFNVTFDLFSKIDVNGSTTHPLYQYLKEQAKGIFNTQFIKWNFTKFLIDSNGHVVKRYAPITKPDSFRKDIETLLG